MPKLVIIAILAIAGVFLLDWVLRRMEARGWIYYRKSHGHGAQQLGPALEQLHGAFDPGAKAAIEYLAEEHAEEEETGEPKRPRTVEP